ncbi:MAG: prolyl oligopeptidase family serine peptidase [Fuerstiella sp.]|nr:prolyl oligopeptidase family serine peptidase [Fuerstiella sp.]MCP4857522.1 prolyl oligopeptidase family serine peptidase [Fuerstiella sp.]
MRNLTLVTSLFVLITAVSVAAAQNQRGPRPAVSPETIALYEPGEFKGVKYRLMKPIDFDQEKAYPLILSLHGAGGRGSQNIKNLRNWNEWLTEEKLRRKHPCFVLAPQSPTSWFDPSVKHSVLPEAGAVKIDDLPVGMRKFGQRAIELAAAVAENPDDPRIQSGVLGKVLEYIDTELSAQYKIDADRVYCLGHSMGGMGTFTAVYQHPDRFAAAIPSAGAFYPWLDAKRIKDVPLWIFHGNDDKVVDYVGSRHPFERLKKLNANTKLTTVTGMGHGSNQLAFTYTGDDPEKGYVTEYASDRPDKTDHVWDWLFKQKRSGQVGRADINKTLQEINNRFRHVDVELVEWPDELQKKLGKMKEIAFMAYPEKKPKGKLPLLISLHGGGGRNMSLPEQLARSADVKGLGLAELAEKDLILLEPNSSDIWDASSLDTMLDYVLESYEEIDENRIYVMGHSMGGYGTWAWINESADRFAAASPSGIPIGDSGDVASLVNLPIWGMVGGGDKKDRVAGIKRMVERLRAAGNKHVKYTEFPGADHAAGNAAVFSSVELVDWMLGFSQAE